MKTKLFLVALAAATLAGCSTIKKVGDWIYDPIVQTNSFTTNIVVRVPEVVLAPDGSSVTNVVEKTVERPVTLVSTNGWILRPGLEDSIQLAGDVAPFPWAGLVSSGILALLGVGEHLKGRKWKKAAVAGVQAADDFRIKLKAVSPEADKEAKDLIVKRQKADGSYETVTQLVRTVLG